MSLVSFREYEPIPVVEKVDPADERKLTIAEVDALDALAARLKIPVLRMQLLLSSALPVHKQLVLGWIASLLPATIIQAL